PARSPLAALPSHGRGRLRDHVADAAARDAAPGELAAGAASAPVGVRVGGRAGARRDAGADPVVRRLAAPAPLSHPAHALSARASSNGPRGGRRPSPRAYREAW